MKFDQTFSISEYVSMLQAPADPNALPETHTKIQEELILAQKEQENGVKKVRLAFRRSGVTRQWIR